MLILQIIIGVVIGGLILANLGAFFGLILIAALAIVGLMIFAGMLSWLLDSPIAILFLIIAIVTFTVWYAKDRNGYQTQKANEDEIERRKMLGYTK